MIVVDILAGLWALACLFVALMELTAAVITRGARSRECLTGAVACMGLALPCVLFLIWRHP